MYHICTYKASEGFRFVSQLREADIGYQQITESIKGRLCMIFAIYKDLFSCLYEPILCLMISAQSDMLRG